MLLNGFFIKNINFLLQNDNSVKIKRNLYLQNKFYNVDLNYRRGLIMGISITIDSKYVELKNRLIGHKSISFKEQYKVVWRLYNGLICKDRLYSF